MSTIVKASERGYCRVSLVMSKLAYTNNNVCISLISTFFVCCLVSCNILCFYTQNFKIRASLCGCAGQIVSYIHDENPKGRFLHDKAQTRLTEQLDQHWLIYKYMYTIMPTFYSTADEKG